ncbi:hypothetical protein M1105_07625 [Limibaculum sp. FT325]|nr:hypothetical protein [Limibaculum sediminis]
MVRRKRVHGISNELGLQLRNKAPKCRAKVKLRDGRREATAANQTRAMEFAHDQLATRRKLGTFTIVGALSRFSSALDERFSYRGDELVTTLVRVCGDVSFRKAIRVNQGSEFVSRDLDLWA